MAVAVCAGAAETLQFRPSADTSLVETAADNSLGGWEFFNVGTTGTGTRNRGLLFFDLEQAIPQGSTVLSATLQIEVVFIPQTAQVQSSIMGLHRMLTDWGEGTQAPANFLAPGFGAPAISGEATWNTPFFGGPETWGAPGGLGGVDYNVTPSATTVVEDADLYMFDALPRVVGDVQSWVTHPDANYGWMLKTLFEEDRYTARRIGDREDPFAAALLTVTFEPIPEPRLAWLLVPAALACMIFRPALRRA